jgi:hypothetical protein
LRQFFAATATSSPHGSSRIPMGETHDILLPFLSPIHHGVANARIVPVAPPDRLRRILGESGIGSRQVAKQES